MIPTFLICNIMEQQTKFKDSDRLIQEDLERIQFLLIDSTHGQLREFAGMISREFFFESN